MRYKVTARTESLVAEFTRLAEAAEKLLRPASADAKKEWAAARSRWPSEAELRQGTIAFSDDELDIMRSKVHRFVSILRAAEMARPANGEIWADHWGAAAFVR